MKGKISVMLLLPLILLVASVHPVAAQGPVMSVDPSSLEVDIGEIFTVYVNITDVVAPGVAAYELKLYFDNTVLNLTAAWYPTDSFIPEPKFEVSVNITEANELGYVPYAVSALPPISGSTGSGLLGAANFTGLTVTETPTLLEIEDVILMDPDENDLTGLTMNDASITVIPEFTAALLMFIFMAITIVGLMLKKLTASKKHNAYCS